MKRPLATDRTDTISILPQIGRQPDFWARGLSELMDLLTFAAIYVTTEVRVWPFAVAGGFTAIRFLSRFRLKTVWMVAGFLIQIFLGIELALRLQLHPLVSAAHIAPIAIAWVGLSRAAENYWGWRVGLGFIGLILASSLTPEFSVMLLILAFIIVGSIALACRFLSNEFNRRGITGSLPPGFIRSSFYQSGILLLSALLIFPFIPRIQGRGGGGGFGNDSPKSGYTEEVNLSDWSRVSYKGSTAAALRIYGPNGNDPTDLIPAGLLRSRVLNVLAGNQWNPASIKIDPIQTVNPIRASSTLMIVREMIGPENLPVPYGTENVAVELYGYRWEAERTKISEWREGRSRNQRFKYYPTVTRERKWAPQDLPTAIELAVPNHFRSSRMKTLTERMFQGARTPEAKIAAVQALFTREQFKAVYAEDELPPQGSAEEKKLPPIERFLFVEKSGHCELFASATAILLRLAGVPTRLIAGFRVLRNAYGDVLTVRQSDAHAWVEAYIPKYGWTVIDPTPKILYISTVTDWLRDTYDWASAKWTQYILNYGEGENSLGAQWEKLKKIGSELASGENPFKSEDMDANLYLFAVIFILGSITFSVIAVMVFRRSLRKDLRIPINRLKRELIREREQMERIRARINALSPENEGLEVAIQKWFIHYEKIRFGTSSTLTKETLTGIRHQRAVIENDLHRSA